ncbi:hypothetical protein K3N28_01750 [Glycomyces sp. TRM65418]|uniref:hypothetical protein n=1 Tax=Glycomyces sp. TRM65418 TaxID=2867006 RepID=UPI001CE4E5E2|nr:hypothetical protein [Glycomyces sp. TRM65418]MCC3761797.1 hypothetical protein [Glycomyces sp. TRM65418]QZD55881.1 hypothetical protein K3N28_01740 [Glycomyces sp. TRM65418]
MSNTVRFGGAVIMALVFGIGFYVMLDRIAMAVVIGLAAAAGWLLIGFAIGRR